MTAGDRTVRIVVHDLSRSGVPVVLGRYLGALPEVERRRVSVLAGWDGPVRRHLERLGVAVGVVWRSTRRRGARLAAPLGGRIAAAAVSMDVRRAARRLPHPDLVVWHGAGSLQLLGAGPPSAATAIHLHELDVALSRCVEPALLRDELNRAETVAVVTPEVSASIERFCGWGGPTPVVPGCADVIAPLEPTRPIARRVVGVGSPDWRKGADRMNAIATELHRRGIDVPVRWIGGRPAGRDQWWVEASSATEWIEPSDDPWSDAEPVGVVVIPSREDPLPLVALEAGARGAPVVAMATGGLPALLADGRGLVVEQGDLQGLVAAVEFFIEHPQPAAESGLLLQEWIRSHFAPDVVSAAWWSTVVGSEDSGSVPVH